MSLSKSVIQVGKIEQRILLIRGEKVIIDADLAEFYGVPTKRLNEQVKRNRDRFPEDFMFQLNKKEKEEVVTNCDHLKSIQFSPNLPFVFTKEGVEIALKVMKKDIKIDSFFQKYNLRNY